MADRYELRLPALRIRQGAQFIYTFGVDGKLIHDFATVSRVHRDDVTLQGYQRPEVLSHIKAIRRYLESDGAMLPNAVVVAFDERVTFVESGTASQVDYVKAGELVIPIDESLPEDQKPAWLVDGQQRSAAIRDADLVEFGVAAVGFIARGEAEQRSQFILVNNTKPLPKGLIHELLPDTMGHLPTAYARKQLPAEVLARLNFGNRAAGAPFAGRIATPTMAEGYIKDNSVLKMIENSLYDGALYQYRDPDDGTGDVDQMVLHLNYFWTIVQLTFPEAWEVAPTKSRLTHGAGIQAMGYVMDALTDGVPTAELAGMNLERSLARLGEHCAWTAGTWDFGGEQVRRWNGIQNTPNDVKVLTSHLLRALKK
ncbi:MULTISPECIES: DGQHR domain-containing protein DpdB [unclassified Nocardioides]|uniref:DGQHR domain-containing protein DpdB n=1 Tax=unclassified Nocardioides TaxID=2615069 RepID=UPI0009F064E0|nr:MULTISPECIES: DGQHR domain-containing protein DpdB [unclassified Nocardioides]GAW49253.1 DGQHR domain-containing protein [Nocardioides sp. PD653-B2]GAW55741.1 DGQHR domain-containing protein [Nocardioides sp. PD653]